MRIHRKSAAKRAADKRRKEKKIRSFRKKAHREKFKKMAKTVKPIHIHGQGKHVLHHHHGKIEKVIVER